MHLNIGERLPGSGPAQQPGGYVVSALVAQTPWYGLYAGKKIFYNFDFTNKRLRETGEAEWGDVLLRTIRYPYLDDPAYVARRRTLARGEVRRILGGRSSNLWPEPVDLLEIPNTRDPFAFATVEDSEPIVVLAWPHGLPLAAWQGTVLPLAAILGVLAELLEFLRQAHAEGLVVRALDPGAIVIDGSERAHYVGTDMVIEAAHAELSPQARARLFPPERFARGFTAPEIFQPEMEPDARADLYAWAALAYFLLTGQSPAQIALEQGKPWPRLQETHFERLDKSLREVPATHVSNWAEQLGTPKENLARGWPNNIVQLFRALLHPDPDRRPRTAQELLAWIDAPPPVPPAAVLALITGPGEAHVYLDWDGLAGGLDMMVRRGVARPPLTPTEGSLLEQGPARSAAADPDVPLTPASVYYTVFARRNDAGGPIYSVGASADLEEASPAAFLRLAEREAAAGGDALPPRLRLLFAVQDKLALIQALLHSDLAVVRGWALAELEQLVRSDSGLAKSEELLWQYLRDVDLALCRRAAGILLTRPRTDQSILDMAHFAGQGNLDDCLRLVDVFAAAGLEPARAERLRDILEEERPSACPECHVPLTRRERSEHLHSQHGYMEVAGSLLPRSQALERLWDQVLSQGEPFSHGRIVQLLAAAPEGLAPAYVDNLKKALPRHAHAPGVAAPGADAPRLRQALQRYLACLVQVPQAEALLHEMLRSDVPVIRDLARDGWLTILGEKLRSAKFTGESLRLELDRLSPDIEEKIDLCRRLAERGIDAEPALVCLGLLEADRPVRCDECGARVRLGDTETHLRRAHGILQFRGVRRSFPETRDAVLAAVCAGVAEEMAWQTLQELAGDQHGQEADAEIVTWLCQALKAQAPEQRAVALAALADVLAQNASGLRLLPRLLGPLRVRGHRKAARQLALEVAARLGPVDPALMTLLEPLLSDRSLPLAARQSAVIGLLRTTGKAGPAAVHLLEAYVAGTGKLRAIEKLHQIEQRIGQAVALDILSSRLEDQVRMTCPKCGTEMIRKDMVEHLWQHHRLVLDGRRVREPWRVLDDWVVDYGLEKDPVLLANCRALASKVDPEGGLILFERKLLGHGVEDPAARADLSARAEQNHATLCPRCFGQVPMQVPSPPVPLHLGSEGLEGAGLRVVILEHGIFPTLEIDTRGELFIQCREPDSKLTRNGVLVVLVGPLVLALIVLTELLTHWTAPVLVMLFLALGLAMFLAGLVFLFWPGGSAKQDRLLNAAWSELVPEVLDELSPEGIAFLGGLAMVSPGKGDVKRRAGVVASACEKITVQATADHATSADCKSVLAPLVRLAAQDAVTAGQDPLPLVADQVGRCLRGRLPLSHASLLLEEFFGPGAPRWAQQSTARLQILVCDQAFAAGLELSDLADIGRIQGNLAAALGLANLDRLAKLRQLWALRPIQSWEHRGEGATIFDLAQGPRLGEKHLARTPDLLVQAHGYDIALGSRGVWFQDVCWAEKPSRVQVVDRRIYGDDGFDLVVGTQHFYFPQDPQELAIELEAWLTYYFQEFLTDHLAWRNRPPSEAGKKLRNRNALFCPECRHVFLGRLGDVGV